MNEIQIFNNPQFGEIRTAGTSENPLFCLADVCKALEMSNPRNVKNRLNESGVHSIDIGVVTGKRSDGTDAIQNVPMNFIDEPNLYKCIFQSRKKEAEVFQDWVTSEVLPAIRKKGGYMVSQENETPEQVMARAILLAQDVISRKDKLIAEQDNEIKEQKKQIEASKPAVVFTSAFEGAETSCLIGELAKIIRQNGVEIGEKRMFVWLRENHYLGSRGERYNVPNQEWVERGYFVIKKGVRSGSNGVLHTTMTTKVTPKGQVYFINKFLNSSEATNSIVTQ